MGLVWYIAGFLMVGHKTCADLIHVNIGMVHACCTLEPKTKYDGSLDTMLKADGSSSED